MPCTSLTVLYCTCRTQLITYSITHCQYLYHLYSRQGSTVRSTVQSIHILSPILLLLLFLLLLLLLYYYYLIHIPYPMPQIICQCQFHRSLQLKLNQNPVPVLVLLLTYYHTIPYQVYVTHAFSHTPSHHPAHPYPISSTDRPYLTRLTTVLY